MMMSFPQQPQRRHRATVATIVAVALALPLCDAWSPTLTSTATSTSSPFFCRLGVLPPVPNQSRSTESPRRSVRQQAQQRFAVTVELSSSAAASSDQNASKNNALEKKDSSASSLQQHSEPPASSLPHCSLQKSSTSCSPSMAARHSSHSSASHKNQHTTTTRPPSVQRASSHAKVQSMARPTTTTTTIEDTTTTSTVEGTATLPINATASTLEILSSSSVYASVPSAQRMVNALILLAAMTCAVQAVLNVDHDITRGWTQSEIAMRLPLDTWSSYEDALQAKPVATKTMINVVIYLLGDWLSQTLFQQRNLLDFDPWRVLRNGFIGLCFGPLVHQYYQFSDHILPLVEGQQDLWWNRVEKIVMDQTVYLTVKCGLYMAAVGFLQGEDWETIRDRIQTRLGGIVFTAWKFWPLVHCLTYSIIPARHRMLWVNCVDLVWNAILASMSQANTEEEEEAAATTREVVPVTPTMTNPKQASGEPSLLFHDTTMAAVAQTEAAIWSSRRAKLVNTTAAGPNQR